MIYDNEKLRDRISLNIYLTFANDIIISVRTIPYTTILYKTIPQN